MVWEVKRDHVKGKYFCTFWLQSKESINMSCYSCSIFSFYNGCCPYTQWSSKEDKCVGMFKAFFFFFLILLHEYCYLDITAFVALTQTYTHDCIIAPHGTINCTLLLSLPTQNVFITYARFLFWYYLLKL